jgi:hypothetical protein
LRVPIRPNSVDVAVDPSTAAKTNTVVAQAYSDRPPTSSATDGMTALAT